MKRIFVGLLCFINPLLAIANPQQQWQQLQTQIKQTRSSLQQQDAVRRTAFLQLQTAEIQKGKFQQQIHSLQQHTAEIEAKISHTQDQLDQLQTSLTNQQQAFANQVRAMYMLGNEPLLKAIINRDSPDKLHRLYTYYTYLAQSQALYLDKIEAIVDTMHQKQAALLTQKASLNQLQNQANAKLLAMQVSDKQREVAIAMLDQQIATREQKLANLLNNQQQLTLTLEHFTEAEDRQKLNSLHFAALKGHLPWPVHGPIISSYGALIDNSRLANDGVIIQAQTGAPVKAVAPGEVIFSSWMPGYGIVVILDHHDGYMTIYGRNETLFKKKGDFVNTGDIISLVGNTGGHQASGLYFAVRYKAKPLNPAQWCHRV